MFRQTWQEFVTNNLGKITGVILGLLLGWMIIEYGFFKTLFVIILITVGFIAGKYADEGGGIRMMINRIFKR